jgi:hypothetical protein
MSSDGIGSIKGQILCLLVVVTDIMRLRSESRSCSIFLKETVDTSVTVQQTFKNQRKNSANCRNIHAYTAGGVDGSQPVSQAINFHYQLFEKKSRLIKLHEHYGCAFCYRNRGCVGRLTSTVNPNIKPHYG